MTATTRVLQPTARGSVASGLVLAGTLAAFAGVASLLAALVAGILVGFGDPAASAGPTPSLALALGLILAGGATAYATRLSVSVER